MADDIKNLLHFDALDAAEKITHKSYKEDKETSNLGMVLHMAASAAKEKLLTDKNDTHHGMKMGYLIDILTYHGYEEVYKETFIGHGWGDAPLSERFMMFWHPEQGVLFKCETFNGDGVNGCDAYFNCIDDGKFDIRASRSYEYMLDGKLIEVKYPDKPPAGAVGVLICGLDGREGYVYNMDSIAGKTLKKWVKRPHLWLLNYMDTKQPDYDSDALNEMRIAKLPDYVREAITP